MPLSLTSQFSLKDKLISFILTILFLFYYCNLWYFQLSLYFIDKSLNFIRSSAINVKKFKTVRKHSKFPKTVGKKNEAEWQLGLTNNASLNIDEAVMQKVTVHHESWKKRGGYKWGYGDESYLASCGSYSSLFTPLSYTITPPTQPTYPLCIRPW